MLISDQGQNIVATETGIEIIKGEASQFIEYCDVKDVQITDGNILQIITNSVTMKYQINGTENNQEFMNDFGIKKLKADRLEKQGKEQNNANNTGNINQITVNVPGNDANDYAKFAVMAGKKSVNKVMYCVLAILLGGIGVHKFYAGKIGMGIVYLIFCPTVIPLFVGLIEGLCAIGKTTDNQGNIYL